MMHNQLLDDALKHLVIIQDFFIVIEDIEKILSPILSRFCNIYIPYPKINKRKQTYIT